MLERIKWAWRILRSNTFVIATEKSAVCRINVRDPFTFDTIVMLAAQYSSLLNFKERLEDVAKEHEDVAQKEFGITPNDFKKASTRRKASNNKEGNNA